MQNGQIRNNKIRKEINMKTVFNSMDTVASKWAEQSQERGRNTHDSISFEGKTIYSYSTAIASFVKSDVVLISDKYYSRTTSNHQQTVLWKVTHGIRKYCVNNCTASCESEHNSNVENLMWLIKERSDKFWRARKRKEYHFQLVQNRLKEVKAYCKEFSLTLPILLPEEIICINPKAEEIIFLRRAARKLLGK